MKSFETETLDPLPLTHGIVRATGFLREFRGREQLNEQQSPQVLQTLREAAIIQSTESSNRIEGVVAPHQRIKALVQEKTIPRNRSEQEIAGYRDVLATIHANHEHIPFSAGVVLQFHRNLFGYTETPGGRWKATNNSITEKHPDGRVVTRFETVPAHLTEQSMHRLHERFDVLWQSREIDQLLLIPAYVLDFLCIHPFLDGNGRMARLLSLLLLYKAGFGVGRYISLEMIVERTKESYYDTLYQSSQGWHEAQHTLRPWTEYFLGIVTAAYKDFEERVGQLTSAPGAKTKMVIDATGRLPDGFRISDVERVCPSVSRDLIRLVLNKLRKDNVLRLEGAGSGSRWYRNGPPVADVSAGA